MHFALGLSQNAPRQRRGGERGENVVCLLNTIIRHIQCLVNTIEHLSHLRSVSEFPVGTLNLFTSAARGVLGCACWPECDVSVCRIRAVCVLPRFYHHALYSQAATVCRYSTVLIIQETALVLARPGIFQQILVWYDFTERQHAYGCKPPQDN